MLIDYNDDVLRDLIERKFPQVLDRLLDITTAYLWGEIGREAPVREGLLSGSFDIRDGPFPFTREIHSSIEYLFFVHEGTGLYGPHQERIKPVRAKALKFYWEKLDEVVIFKGDLETKQERYLFARWAEERGMKPFFTWPAGKPADRFIDRAIESTEMRVDEFARRAMREVVG